MIVFCVKWKRFAVSSAIIVVRERVMTNQAQQFENASTFGIICLANVLREYPARYAARFPNTHRVCSVLLILLFAKYPAMSYSRGLDCWLIINKLSPLMVVYIISPRIPIFPRLRPSILFIILRPPFPDHRSVIARVYTPVLHIFGRG